MRNFPAFRDGAIRYILDDALKFVLREGPPRRGYMTASFSIRRHSAADRRTKYGGSRSICSQLAQRDWKKSFQKTGCVFPAEWLCRRIFADLIFASGCRCFSEDERRIRRIADRRIELRPRDPVGNLCEICKVERAQDILSPCPHRELFFNEGGKDGEAAFGFGFYCSSE